MLDKADAVMPSQVNDSILRSGASSSGKQRQRCLKFVGCEESTLLRKPFPTNFIKITLSPTASGFDDLVDDSGAGLRFVDQVPPHVCLI